MKKSTTTRSTKPERTRGRPTGAGVKLTPAVQDKILTAIRQGNYLETAAALAGIQKETFYDWLRKGARSTTDDRYRNFSDAVFEAMAQSEAEAVAAIDTAGMPHDVVKTRTIRKPLFLDGQQVADADGNLVFIEETVTERTRETDWRALAWRLERRFPRRWGHRSYTETTMTEKPVDEMSDAEIDAELNEILKKCNER